MTQIAVAAGVCLVAVVGVQSFNAKSTSVTPENPVLQTLPFNNSVQEVSYNAPTKDVATSEQVEQKNRRIGTMLQNYELQRRMHADQTAWQSTASVAASAPCRSLWPAPTMGKSVFYTVSVEPERQHFCSKCFPNCP